MLVVNNAQTHLSNPIIFILVVGSLCHYTLSSDTNFIVHVMNILHITALYGCVRTISLNEICDFFAMVFFASM